MARQRKYEYWIVWSQHWVGYKPTKFGEHKTEKEAMDSCARLNASPSARWYRYHVDHVPAKEQNEVTA